MERCNKYEETFSGNNKMVSPIYSFFICTSTLSLLDNGMTFINIYRTYIEDHNYFRVLEIMLKINHGIYCCITENKSGIFIKLIKDLIIVIVTTQCVDTAQ